MTRVGTRTGRGQSHNSRGRDAVIKVMVADAQHLFSEVLATALDQFSDLEVLDVYPTTAPEAVQAIVQRQPDIALLDLWMPGMDEPAVAQSLMSWIPEGQVIFLSWYHGPEHVTRAMRLGAAGFIPKTSDISGVVEAIRQAHSQKLPALAEQIENLLQAIKEREEFNRRICERVWTLTPRELQVVRQISTGRPLKEVAEHLGITSGTVKAHIRKILLKTEAQSQKQVIAMARFCGAIT